MKFFSAAGALSVLSTLFFALPVALAQSLPASGLLLVDQKGDRSLALVDPAAGRVMANVAESGVTGHEVVASHDGRYAYVPIYGNSGVGKPGTDGREIDVVDLASRKIVSTIQFDHGVRPHCAVLGPDGLLYVTTELDRSVTIIDPKTLKIVGSISTGQEQSHMLAISRDGRRGYTANVGPGTVSVLDMKARQTLAIIPVSPEIQRISISPDGQWVFTADQTEARLAVISTQTNSVKTWVRLSGTGYGSAITPDGRFLLIAVPDANNVDVVDLSAMTRVRSIPVAQSPQEVLIAPGGKTAYVSCTGSNEVDAIDLGSWTVTGHIATGKGTDGLGWALRE